MKRAAVSALWLMVLGASVVAGGCRADREPRPGTETPPGAGSAGKLFVDVSVEDYIEVIDLATRKTVDKIVVGPHPHGLVHDRQALAGRTYDLIFVTVEQDGELVIVDAERHNVIGRVYVGKVPNELTITRDHRFAYVPLRQEAKVAVVELGIGVEGAPGEARLTARPKVLKRMPIGEWPHNSYTGQTSGLIYVTSFRGKKIHVFDPQTHEMLYQMEFPGEVRPVALTKDETRAYVAQSDFHGFVVADMRARKVIERVELPPLPPETPVPFLRTYVHGLVLSADERELWLTSCAGAAVYVYSVPDLKMQAKIPVGKFPHWFAWQPPFESVAAEKKNGWLLWVSEMDSNQVSAIDTATRRVVATVPTGPQPRRIVVVPPPAS